ncbi:DNA mismatch repair protein MutS [Russula ochroleuca]|uniref:DNA mismatch repair protein MutS n=1 Tax=Russula ochroleuca TaxID=152965 RepID=A0A9P5MSD6_9AGAM|nr:DNA mismatch repair protein MutS [Russula ochroleuca]
MSRTSLGTAQEPLAHTDTPDPDGRSKKRVRWNSDSMVEDDKQGDSEESSQDCKVGGSCPFIRLARIGCAYYNPVNFLIYVLEDTQETPQFDVTRTLLDQVFPDIFLVSSKADDRFIDLCMAASGGFFQIRPQKDFRPERGRNNLLSLGLLSDLPEEILDAPDPDASMEPRNAYEFMQRKRITGDDPTLRRWNASIRMSNFATLDMSPFALGSIGALLDYLIREKALGDLESEGIKGLDVRGIVNLSLDKTMQINADALFSLQVFENESHASIHSTKTKEGLSLFGTLDSTRTSLGRSLLRTWLLRPSLSLAVINARHDAVECFTRPENLDIANIMHSQLGGIKNVPRILSALKAGKATLANWQGLVKFTFHTAMLRDKLGELSMAGDVDIVKKLITALDIAAFREVGKAVNETIDWEESTLLQRVCIRPHIDEELDNRKHVYNGIDAVLSKVAEGISPTVPQSYATSLNVVYFPQLGETVSVAGFLVCVPMLEEWRSGDGIEVLDGWTFQDRCPISTFITRSHVYFKNDKMHDLDKHLGDLYPSIIDRELEIIHELAESVLPFAGAISEACDICAELDCLLCFAEAANQYNYSRPQMSEENVTNIKQGRHPLQEQTVDTFVPNDILIVGGAGIGSYPAVHVGEDDGDNNLMSEGVSVLGNSVVICTGANACGKVKETLDLGFAGVSCPYDPSFVPAESATLGIVDKIFTRVQTRESVSKVQSAFMIDLNQVSLALRNATARSLILLDEFGKGTAAAGSYGAGLFAGVLKHLLSRGSDCPKVIATTHFHELFSTGGALDPQNELPITFIHLEIMFATRGGEIIDSASSTTVTKGENITYLYRAVSGLSLESHAARCAQLFGVPTHVVQRAQYVTELLSVNELPKLLDEAISEEEQLDMDLASAVCQRFLEWDLETQEVSLGQVRARLAQVLGRDVDRTDEE